MKAVIMESLAVSEDKLNSLKKPFEEEGIEFKEYTKAADPEVLKQEAADADIMILANMPMPSDVIRACEKLKFIDIAFTGVDHVGMDAAKERGIAVSNASGYADEAVAELVIGMIISHYRNLRTSEDRCRQGKTKEGLGAREIRGKTVGIIGLGKIGRRTAKILDAFSAKVLAHNSRPLKDKPEYVEETAPDDLLQRSDIVILHCPLNDETKGMINAEKLSLMKSDALLVNAARGPVVVSRDLADALRRGTIAGACLDVFDKEPPLDPEDPLLKAPNTIVTPHTAFMTEESMELRADIVFENLRAWLDGRQINKIL